MLNQKSSLDKVIALAINTGKEVLKFYHQDKIKVVSKTDYSPKTEVDLLAHEMIAKGLKTIDPILPILSEESSPDEIASHVDWQTYWLIDPLDGTKEFLQGLGQFTINIALIENHMPILGVVYAPVDEVCYYATATLGAHKIEKDGKITQLTSIRQHHSDKIIVVASNSEKDDALQKILQPLARPYTVLRMGSSLKICLVAEGKADIYPRLFPINEWDIAAAHCILLNTGGDLYLPDQGPLRYNLKSSLLIPEFFAINNRHAAWLKLIST